MNYFVKPVPFPLPSHNALRKAMELADTPCAAAVLYKIDQGVLAPYRELIAFARYLEKSHDQRRT